MNNHHVFPKGRYLVTGGAGFVGSHLCETLLERGCEVVSVDNFITGKSDNYKTLLGSSQFESIEHDLIQPLQLTGALAGIFHMASPASPIDYAKFPIETLRVGALGSQNVLELAKAKDCPVLVASTSEVYGDPLEHPQKEAYWGNVNPIGPRGCYDESKRYLEALTMAYHRVHKLRTRIIRIFNTYGPRMRTDDGRVIPNFSMQALKNEDITIYGDGSQTRSFCYISDLIEGILRRMSLEDPLPMNLGNPQEISIKELATRIIEFSGSRSQTKLCPLPEDDPKLRCPDISRAKELLNWEPKVELRDGVTKTLEYFKLQLPGN